MDARTSTGSSSSTSTARFCPTQVFGEVMLGQENASVINMASMGSFTHSQGFRATPPPRQPSPPGPSGLPPTLQSGIRVNCMAPGFADSAQNHFLPTAADKRRHPGQQRSSSQPPRWENFGDVHDLVGGMLFLCDPKGSKLDSSPASPWRWTGGFQSTAASDIRTAPKRKRQAPRWEPAAILLLTGSASS